MMHYCLTNPCAVCYPQATTSMLIHEDDWVIMANDLLRLQISALTSELDALQAKVDGSVILTAQAVTDMRHIIKMGWGDDLCDYLTRALDEPKEGK